MKVAQQPAMRTLAFGDFESELWGAALFEREGQFSPGLVWPGGNAPGSLLEGSSPEQAWRLVAPGGELAVEPLGEATPLGGPEDESRGMAQLCRVQGRFGDGDRIDSRGVRSFLEELDTGALDSIRAVSAWFGSEEGVALLALRPRKAKGSESDQIAAALLGSDDTQVSDPRLSTTYSSAGRPIRASLELWLGGEESEERYPRRVGGEATGAGSGATTEKLAVRAELFTWHSAGRDGAGIYLLAGPR